MCADAVTKLRTCSMRVTQRVPFFYSIQYENKYVTENSRAFSRNQLSYKYTNFQLDVLVKEHEECYNTGKLFVRLSFVVSY